MKIKLLSLAALLACTQTLYAKTCSNLKECVDVVSELTNQQYMYTVKLDGKVNLTDNFEIKKKTADKFLSSVLFENGYSRVKTSTGDWKIIKSRDVRYTTEKSFTYDKKKIPRNHDYYLVSFPIKNEHVIHEMTRSYRPFLSRYGRILSMNSSKQIILHDTGNSIHRFKEMLDLADKKPSKETLKRITERRKQNQKLKLVQSKNCGHLETKIDHLTTMLFDKKHKGFKQSHFKKKK